MKRRLALCVAAFGLVAACASGPKSAGERSALQASADRTIQEMTARDPGLRTLMDRSVGYVVFPEVGQGGFIVGGAAGKGVVYENGRPTGFAELSQASIGLQAGGQTFSELIIFRDAQALSEMKAGDIDMSTRASAVIVKSGAATSADFDKGVAVFIHPRGGAMFDVSLSGQKIKYTM